MRMRWHWIGLATVLLAPTTAQARIPGPAAWLRNQSAKLQLKVVKRAWAQHARKQVTLSNENGRRNSGCGNFIAHQLVSSRVANVKPGVCMVGKPVNVMKFDGYYAWKLAGAVGGSGYEAGPLPSQIPRRSLVGNMATLLGLRPLPAVQLQPVYALELAGR